MKIEQYIVASVVMMMMAACGSYKKNIKEELEADISGKRIELTDMSGIGVMEGNARMSEGMSVQITEIHYSEPDTLGRQHVTKKVVSDVTRNRSLEGEVTKKDSVNAKTVADGEMHVSIDESNEVDNEICNDRYIHFLFFTFLAIALAKLIRLCF